MSGDSSLERVERETKSWAWVNERPCDECGFDASRTDPTDVPDLLRAAADDWARLLSQPLDRLVARPDERTWSPLEYACHVRDVLALLGYRFERVLAEDRPVFDDWHPNDRAESGDYAARRDPDTVSAELVANARSVITRAESMSDDEWQRRGTRADGLEFTNAWLSTYLTHDVIHHVHDVESVLRER